MFSDAKPQPMPAQNSFNRTKLKKVIFSGSTQSATLIWSNWQHSVINLKSVDNEACIYEYSLEEEHGSQIIITGCAKEVKELQLTSVTYGKVFAIVNLDGFVNEVQIGPVADRTQITRLDVDKTQTYVDTIDNFDDFNK